MGSGEVVVATGSCDRSCQCAIAPNTFLREVPLTVSASGSAWSWQMLIYLLRIPLRTATPFTATYDRLRPLHASQSPHPRSRLELARTGGISSDWRVARIEQPCRIFARCVSCSSFCHRDPRRLRRPVIRRGSPLGEANGPDG